MIKSTNNQESCEPLCKRGSWQSWQAAGLKSVKYRNQLLWIMLFGVIVQELNLLWDIQDSKCGDRLAILAWVVPRFQTSPYRRSRWTGLYFIPLVWKPLPNLKYFLAVNINLVSEGTKEPLASYNVVFKKKQVKNDEFHRQIDSEQYAELVHYWEH